MKCLKIRSLFFAGIFFLSFLLSFGDVFAQTDIYSNDEDSSYHVSEDTVWTKLQETDSIYKGIVANSYNQTWWASSGSSLPEIIKYKEFYIQAQQATNRSVLYMITLSKMLDNLGIKHLYFSTYFFDYSSHDNYKDLEALPWTQINQGMEEWSKQFGDIRGSEVQPRPLIHLKYIIEHLLPKLDLALDPQISNAVYSLVDKVEFIPYDIDRSQIWNNLKDEINLLFE